MPPLYIYTIGTSAFGQNIAAGPYVTHAGCVGALLIINHNHTVTPIFMNLDIKFLLMQ